MRISARLVTAGMLVVAASMEAAAEPAREQCLRYERLDRWRAADDTHVTLVDKSDREFEVVMHKGCRADAIANYPIFDSLVNFGCARAGDAIKMSQGGFCMIETITPKQPAPLTQ